MADTLYDVTSGFYDSINQDRLYTADQMNMPYKRLISEGVFATPAGTASTDFQVLAVSERNVKVCAGNAILGEKWVESNADQPITIGGNTTGNPRIDSIVLRVDRNNTERKASIIYRTGEAASSPTAPALNTGSNIYELRLADILVASGTNTISQSAITDQRGSAECPWITSLIYQVDTSTLFEQYREAQEEQFETFETNWENFIENLDRQETSGVTATTGTVTTVDSAGVAKSYSMKTDFGITNYDPTGDIIMLYINGLYAIEGDKWELVPTADPEDPAISFANGTTADQNLYMVVLKPVAPTPVEEEDLFAFGICDSSAAAYQKTVALRYPHNSFNPYKDGQYLAVLFTNGNTEDDYQLIIDDMTYNKTGFISPGNMLLYRVTSITAGGAIAYELCEINHTLEPITNAQIDALFE